MFQPAIQFETAAAVLPENPVMKLPLRPYVRRQPPGGNIMARKLIDISVPLQNDVPADPPGGHPTIQYIDHQQGLPRMLQFFEGLKAEELPDGQGWAIEQVQLFTHNGTHLDAPWHFHPTMNRGERSWTIDEVPLEWCLQPGVKLDFRHLPEGYVATAKDVENELMRIGHTLSPLEIVVVNTSAGVNTAGRTMSPRVVAWAMRRPCICWSEAYG
jgi:kynurenine formamidase